MTLRQNIELAFADRVRPGLVISKPFPETPEEKDAFAFQGVDWKAVTWEHWDKYPDAAYAFSPEAFKYYLPSILSTSIAHPEMWMQAADAILGVLDRSPDSANWDEFLLTRLFGLREAEYEVISQWVAAMKLTTSYAEIDFDRAYASVEILLEKST